MSSDKMESSFHNSFVGFAKSPNPLRSIRVPRRDSAALAKGQDSNENNLAPKPQPPQIKKEEEERKPLWFDK